MVKVTDKKRGLLIHADDTTVLDGSQSPSETNIRFSCGSTIVYHGTLTVLIHTLVDRSRW